MKKKFIRILSPITIAVIASLDCAVIGFAVFAVKKIIEVQNLASVFFAVVEILAIITGALVTKEIFNNGILFYDDEFEFTGLDENNIFAYSDIAELETYRDIKASLTKNFVDRHTLIIITLTNGKVATVDIGLATKKSVAKFQKELEKHISKDKIKTNK